MQLLNKLQSAVFQSEQDKIATYLSKLQNTQKFSATDYQHYIKLLMFIRVYAMDAKTAFKAAKELLRLTRMAKQQSKWQIPDSGLPYSFLVTRYSFDLCTYLQVQDDIRLAFDSLEDEDALKEMLALTLPLAERECLTAELSKEELFLVLGVPTKDILVFLLNQLRMLPNHAILREQYWQRIKPFIRFKLNTRSASIPFNYLSFAQQDYGTTLLKKFNTEEVINKPLSKPLQLTEKQQQELVKVIRYSMFLTLRETDTVTYMAEDSIRYIALDRGYSVALYGMQGLHQLPVQSYIGYTLFRNGYPMAYGGAWILADDARFGLNLFEWFRGGESGYVFAQLLRVYKQGYGLKRMEIDAYMYGKDNPEGISSGAYWFYYRFGFRSMSSELRKLSEKEATRISMKKGYRSSSTILRKLTESNMALQFETTKQTIHWNYATDVSNYIKHNFQGNRFAALQHARQELLHFLQEDMQQFNESVFDEWSLLAQVYKLLKRVSAKDFSSLIKSKVSNPEKYNELLKKIW